MNRISPRPLVMNWIVWLAPKSAGALEIDGAEDGAGMEPRPPITTMEMITNEVVGRT